MTHIQDPPPLPESLSLSIEGQPDISSASTKLGTYRTQLAIYRTGIANLRSHLANERTHLGYLRTTVSLIGFGITLNRFSMYLLQSGEQPAGRALLRDTGNAGLAMVILGLLLLVWSLYRYWRVGQDIEKGIYSARNKGTLVASFGLLLLGGLTALWLFIR